MGPCFFSPGLPWPLSLLQPSQALPGPTLITVPSPGPPPDPTPPPVPLPCPPSEAFPPCPLQVRYVSDFFKVRPPQHCLPEAELERKPSLSLTLTLGEAGRRHYGYPVSSS